jgi:hypothetical protein
MVSKKSDEAGTAWLTTPNDEFVIQFSGSTFPHLTRKTLKQLRSMFFARAALLQNNW